MNINLLDGSTELLNKETSPAIQVWAREKELAIVIPTAQYFAVDHTLKCLATGVVMDSVSAILVARALLDFAGDSVKAALASETNARQILATRLARDLNEQMSRMVFGDLPK